MAILYAPFIYVFPLPPYLFISLRLLFFLWHDDHVPPATLCSISTFPSEGKTRLPDATSSAKLNLSSSRFLRKYDRPDTNKCLHRNRPPNPPPYTHTHTLLVLCFLILHFTAFSTRQNFFHRLCLKSLSKQSSLSLLNRSL